MDFSQKFACDHRILFLNSGSLSRTPLDALNFLQNEQRVAELNPTAAIFNSYPRIWDAQKATARFFGADPREFFFRSNITAALNTFFSGLFLERGSEILVSDCEYGATVNIAKLKAEKCGGEVRSFSFYEGTDPSSVCPKQIIENVKKAVSSKTKVLLVSHVTTGQGIVFPIMELGCICRELGIYFVVDGAHGAGALEIDFSQLQEISFYGGNLHKWMMGPKGTAFGWMPRWMREHWSFVDGGWASYGTPDFFQNFGEGDEWAAKLWIPGTIDYTPFLALPSVLKFWDDIGHQNIRRELFLRQEYMKQAMEVELPDWGLMSPREKGSCGPLLAYALPEHLERMGDLLPHELYKKYGLQILAPIVKGKMLLRLTPHIYTTHAEMDRAVSTLKAIHEKK